MTDSAHSPDVVLPIVRLVREKVGNRGLRPFAKERGISYSTLRHYYEELTEPLEQLPRPETIQNLAHALRVSPQRVRLAAIDSLAGRYPASAEPTIPAQTSDDPTRQIIDLVMAHPGLHPVNKAHLAKQVEILAMVPVDADLEPHATPATREQARAEALIDELPGPDVPADKPRGGTRPNGRR